MRTVLALALLIFALGLLPGCASETKEPAAAPTPENSGADKPADKKKSRFPTPPPKN